MTATYILPIRNMHCGSCAARVTRTLEEIAGASDVAVNLATETAQINVTDAKTTKEMLSKLEAVGYPVATQTIQFTVSGMSCASCVSALDRALRAAEGVQDVAVNLASETASVTYVPSITNPEALADIAGAAGYPMTPPGDSSQEDAQALKDTTARSQRNAVFWAAALTLPVFVLEMGGHLFPAWHHFIAGTIGQTASWIVQFVLTTLVLIGPGRQFFTGGLAALRRGAPNMNSLVALGAGAAWTYSTLALFAPALMPAGSAVVYFEAAAVIVTLILMGRWFEARAKGQAGAAIRSLIDLQPRLAMVRQGEDWIETPVADLGLGDVVRVQPGARIPIDAEVTGGTSQVDESMITGEPMPVTKAVGDPVTGGSVNGNGSLTCAVTRIGADTTLAQIVRMVETAQNARLPIQALVDRITLWFVPAVLAIAVLTVAIWLIFGPSVSLALVAGVSVLIIACPCAMGLATPTSIMVGTGRAATLGVLFRQGDALQALGNVDVVAFDKTGTLTEGRPALTTFEVAEGFEKDATLALVAAVEAQSEHAVARAIQDAASALELPEAQEFQAITGQGAKAVVAGTVVYVGNAHLMAAQDIDIAAFDPDPLSDSGQTVFFAAVDGKAAAMIAVSDPIKPTSAAAIAALKSRGIRVAMITGDAPGTARAVAAEMGIDNVTAGVLPEGKVAAFEALRAGGAKVAFVGDGINDAPVLAAADVGIAIGTGTDVAIETADVVLMSGDLPGVVTAFDLSRLTLRNIRQNLFWAFGYNIVLIPVAAGALYPAFGILLSPGLAAGAMACSSIFVLLNALRLRRVGEQP